MHVTLLGTGCPPADVLRHGPATLVVAGSTRVLVDCGSGVSQRLIAAGCPGRDVDALLLTHLHSDHLVDLYQLVISSWHAGRPRPQRVFGPPGTRAHVTGLMDLWRREREGRIAHERRPGTAGLVVDVVEIAHGQMLDFPGLRVTVVGVNHQPVKHAFGFVFESADARAAISGDTTYCPALIEAAAGVDLLVHEVFMHHEMPEIPGVRTAEGTRNVASYHTLSSVVGRVATEASARCLMLTHFVPPRFDRARLMDEVTRGYRGPVLIGEDLMSCALPQRTITHAGAMIGLGAGP